MPSELLRQWSGSAWAAGCGLPGSESTPQPRAEGETGGRRQSFTACARPLRPRTLCKSKRLWSEFGSNPPAGLCLAEGAGGGRRAEGGRRG